MHSFNVYHYINDTKNNYLAVGVISGSNNYIIDGSTKIKNYQKEEVEARCFVEADKLILTITGGKAGTVQITRLIKDDKLHVEQVFTNYFPENSENIFF